MATGRKKAAARASSGKSSRSSSKASRGKGGAGRQARPTRQSVPARQAVRRPSVDLSSLATVVASPSGGSRYAEASVPDGVSVCPRADAFGGRDGVIPPGVAARLGLYRRPLRHITAEEQDASDARRRREAAGKSVEEQYREYYSTPSSESGRARPSRSQPAAPVVRPAPRPADDYDPYGGEEPEPMFSRDGDDPDYPAEGTVDDFYDDLERDPIRTMGHDRSVDELRREVEELRRLTSGFARSLAEEPASRPVKVKSAGRDDPPPDPPRVVEAPPAAPRASSTVRVVLSGEQERLRVGGVDGDGEWSANVMGHVDRSRDGRTVSITVTDTSYASELLAAIRPGRSAVLSRSGRIDCVYSGVCHKLYAGAGDPDYIAIVSFDVAG